MPANPERRRVIVDAATRCLADGARSLTFRQVDQAAHVPTGTTSNFFASRGALLFAVAERVFERLAPDDAALASVAGHPTAERAEAYMVQLVDRLLRAPDASLALFELRLAARRDTELRDHLMPFLRAGLDDDAAFHLADGLPGDAADVVLLHHAIDGLVFDRLTAPLVDDADPRETARLLTRRILGTQRTDPRPAHAVGLPGGDRRADSTADV